MQLPSDLSPADFHNKYRTQPGAWMGAVRELCDLHEISFEGFRAFEDGSNLVAAVAEQYVVKIFPGFHRNQWESERRALQHLWKERSLLPIPELTAQGERSDGWTYVILSKLPGVTLESIWPQCSEDERAALLSEIGVIMARVHSLSIAGIKDLDPEWSLFLDDQIAKCRARHQRLGMPAWLLENVERFVADTPKVLPAEMPVLLTGEYTPFNLLVEGGPGKWRISGMIDFGDSMIGFREYDFLGPCLFLAGGNPRLIRSLFEGYGYRTLGVEDQIGERLMRLAILHRYSNLKFQIRIEGWQAQVNSIEKLQRFLFPFS